MWAEICMSVLDTAWIMMSIKLLKWNMKNCSAYTAWARAVQRPLIHVLRKAWSVSGYRLPFPLCIFFFYPFVSYWNSEISVSVLCNTALACLGVMPWMLHSLDTAIAYLCGCQQCLVAKDLVSDYGLVCNSIYLLCTSGTARVFG